MITFRLSPGNKRLGEFSKTSMLRSEFVAKFVELGVRPRLTAADCEQPLKVLILGISPSFIGSLKCCDVSRWFCGGIFHRLLSKRSIKDGKSYNTSLPLWISCDGRRSWDANPLGVGGRVQAGGAMTTGVRRISALTLSILLIRQIGSANGNGARSLVNNGHSNADSSFSRFAQRCVQWLGHKAWLRRPFTGGADLYRRVPLGPFPISIRIKIDGNVVTAVRAQSIHSSPPYRRAS